jgi:adenine-specific DNA methylase
MKALSIIKQLDVPDAIRDRLAFSVLGAAEMPAFLSRWDRLHLKSFEGMANHRYTQTTLAVETNLLSPVGRGTLPRRLDAASATLQWLVESGVGRPRVVLTTAGRRGRTRTAWDLLIASGSSATQALRDASVSVVVTDPPYCDDVQYGELARLFHTWLKIYDPKLSFDDRDEAVPNSVRGISIADYENTIAACLSESRRTLKKDGTLILTFHNKKLKAWQALAGAICKSGFGVNALAVVRAENGADHCKRSVKAMLHDLVLECTPITQRMTPRVRLAFEPKTRPEFNLAAIGLAVAQCAMLGSPAGLQSFYEQHLARWTTGKRLVE